MKTSWSQQNLIATCQTQQRAFRKQEKEHLHVDHRICAIKLEAHNHGNQIHWGKKNLKICVKAYNTRRTNTFTSPSKSKSPLHKQKSYHLTQEWSCRDDKLENKPQHGNNWQNRLATNFLLKCLKINVVRAYVSRLEVSMLKPSSLPWSTCERTNRLLR